MRVEQRKIFTFDELSNEAKERAIEECRNLNTLNYDWWDGVYDWADDVFSALGVESSAKYFSGFWSQGDGACFVGTYCYSEGWREKLKCVANDDTLIDIGERLQAAQRPSFYRLWASISHHGHYCHEMSMIIHVEDNNDSHADLGDRGDEVVQCLRELAMWLYRALEREHEWLTSDEQLSEHILANELEFTELGQIN